MSVVEPMLRVVVTQCNEEQHFHSAATSTSDSLIHGQAQQATSAVTWADAALTECQRS